MALARGALSGLRLLEVAAPASRGLHATCVQRMGAYAHDEPYYLHLHAKHMYNLHKMKHQKLKASLSVVAAVGVGVGIAVPVYAVVFQQKKTASG